MVDKDGFKLTTTQMIALQTCLRAVAQAQEQLRIVQVEVGFDLSKNYSITPDGFAHEIEEQPKVEVKNKGA